MTASNFSLKSLLLTCLLVVSFREAGVYIADYLDMPATGSIAAMLALLIVLLLWRYRYGLPESLIESGNVLLTDSALAYLPVSAGAGILLFTLGDELWRVLGVTLIATVLPFWVLVRLAQHWLAQGSSVPSELTSNKDGL